MAESAPIVKTIGQLTPSLNTFAGSYTFLPLTLIRDRMDINGAIYLVIRGSRNSTDTALSPTSAAAATTSCIPRCAPRLTSPAPDLSQDNAAIYGELPGLTEADHTTESHLIFGGIFIQFNLRLTLSRQMWYNDPTDTEEGWA